MNIRTSILDLLAPRAERNEPATKGITIYGDSIGYSLFLADRLAVSMPGIVVVDRSMPGDTAEQAWRRFPYDVRSTNTVVLQVGTNDLGLGRDPLPALRKMASYARDEGRVTVFTGITWRVGLLPVAETNERILELAEEFGAVCANWQAIPLIADDGLHPVEPMRTALHDSLVSSLQTLKGLQ